MIHPGSMLVVGPPHDRRTAAVTCLLATRGSSRPTHLVTAGHSFPRDTTDRSVAAVTGIGDVPRPIGRMILSLLDRSAAAEPGIDAALVQLDPGVPFSGPGAGARFANVAPVNPELAVRPWLPSRNGLAATVRLAPHVAEGAFRSTLRPDGFLLHDLLATAPSSSLGDSGAPLIDTADPPRAIGLLVGRLGHHSVFQRLPEALSALIEASGLPLGLARWRVG